MNHPTSPGGPTKPNDERSPDGSSARLSAQRRRRGWQAAALALMILGATPACRQEQSDDEPDRVVAEFIERMQRVHGERKNARAAYDLLWSDARRNLAERAKRASDVAGREIAPEEMLPPSRFSLHHKPRRFEARVDGDWAEVTVTSEDSAVERIKSVREDGNWRVVLELPPLPPIEHRPDAGT